MLLLWLWLSQEEFMPSSSVLYLHKFDHANSLFSPHCLVLLRTHVLYSLTSLHIPILNTISTLTHYLCSYHINIFCFCIMHHHMIGIVLGAYEGIRGIPGHWLEKMTETHHINHLLKNLPETRLNSSKEL